jgi:hypothetical protein
MNCIRILIGDGHRLVPEAYASFSPGAGAKPGVDFFSHCK